MPYQQASHNTTLFLSPTTVKKINNWFYIGTKAGGRDDAFAPCCRGVGVVPAHLRCWTGAVQQHMQRCSHSNTLGAYLSSLTSNVFRFARQLNRSSLPTSLYLAVRREGESYRKALLDTCIHMQLLHHGVL